MSRSNQIVDGPKTRDTRGRIRIMNVGTVFEEDGVYKILVKLGDDGWPQTKRYISVSEMLGDLQSIGLPFEELVDFCFCGLQSKGRLAQLPGRTEDWSAYLGQG